MPGELGTCLRAWRERLSPVEASLPFTASRRTPGLRREEIAAEAGISVNYLTRLEQGRALAPSPSVTSALARALRLTATETAYLQTLAGHADSNRADRRTAYHSFRLANPRSLRGRARDRDRPRLDDR